MLEKSLHLPFVAVSVLASALLVFLVTRFVLRVVACACGAVSPSRETLLTTALSLWSALLPLPMALEVFPFTPLWSLGAPRVSVNAPSLGAALLVEECWGWVRFSAFGAFAVLRVGRFVSAFGVVIDWDSESSDAENDTERVGERSPVAAASGAEDMMDDMEGVRNVRGVVN